MKNKKYVIYSEDVEAFLSSDGISLTKKISKAKQFNNENEAKQAVKNSELRNTEFTICAVEGS
jgi:hypothetical protein